jgi:hypothetical protein
MPELKLQSNYIEVKVLYISNPLMHCATKKIVIAVTIILGNVHGH